MSHDDQVLVMLEISGIQSLFLEPTNYKLPMGLHDSSSKLLRYGSQKRFIMPVLHVISLMKKTVACKSPMVKMLK